MGGESGSFTLDCAFDLFAADPRCQRPKLCPIDEMNHVNISANEKALNRLLDNSNIYFCEMTNALCVL